MGSPASPPRGGSGPSARRRRRSAARDRWLHDRRVLAAGAAGVEPDDADLLRRRTGGLAIATAASITAALAAALGVGAPLALVLLVVAALLLLRTEVGPARRATTLRRAIDEHGADLVDLTAALLLAGHTLGGALTEATAGIPPTVSAVLRAALTAPGGENAAATVTGALDIAADRWRVELLGRVATTAARSERLGMPLEPHLRALADALRAEHHAAVLTRAGRAAPLGALLTAIVIAPACIAAMGALLLAGVLPGRPP